MRTVNELLDQVRANAGIQSDYRLAKTLNLTANTIANYRHGRSRPDDLVLSKLAELGGIPADQVELLAVTLQAERASTDEARALWQRIAARLQAGAVHGWLLACLVALGFITTPPNAVAAVTDLQSANSRGSVYYVNKLLALLRAFLRTTRGQVIGKLASPQQHRDSHVSCAWSAAPAFAFAR